MKHSSPLVVVLLPVLFVAGFLTFHPGLSGPFLLDDLLHLPKLAGDDGQIDTLSEVYQLVFSGERTVGRQLSYLSLLINDQAWPTSPHDFKRFNILLHLLNGALVFLFARLLANLMGDRNADPRRSDWVALLATALWLVHPLHLSPTMMVIQRMTLLAGTFSLLALIAYIYGRRVLVERPVAGYLWIVLGFGTLLSLGVFSKEPAIMTVGYIIIIETTLLTRDRPPRPTYWRLWAGIFLVLPLLAICAHFLFIIPYVEQLYLKRDFNVVERLMTESRVLLQYLRVIFLPSISASGPYHDDFAVSRGLMDPPSTLLSILAIMTMIGVAIWRRRRNPLLAFSVLWFFIGHLLESTVLPLELYFEHRNYLPMLGFALAFAYWVLQQSGKAAVLLKAGIAGLLALTMSITFVSAKVWGDADLIATVWAAEHPASARARIGTIRYWSKIGDGKRLQHQFELAQKSNPDDAALPLLHLIIERCRDPSAASIGGDISVLKQVVPAARFEHGSLEAIQWTLKNRDSEGCDITDDELETIINLYLNNHRFHGNDNARNILYRALARISSKRGDLDGTIRAMDRAYEARPSFDVPLNQAWLLATARLFQDSAEYLQRARETPPRSRGEWLWRRDKIAEIEELIDLMEQSATKVPPATEAELHAQ